MGLEVLVHDQIAPFLGPLRGSTAGKEPVVELTAPLYEPGSKNNRKRPGSHDPLGGHTASDLRTSHKTLSL